MNFNPQELNDILNIFKAESEEIIQELNNGLVQLEKNPKNKQQIKRLMQLAHSLKGAARTLGFNSIQDITHKLEDILSFWNKEDTVIEANSFRIVYSTCDFLSTLINKSISEKANVADTEVISFINKLKLLTTNENTATPSKNLNSIYLESISKDVMAHLLEMLMVAEKLNTDITQKDLFAILKEKLDLLKTYFENTEYSNILEKVNLLIKYIDNTEIYNFAVFQARIFDLKNELEILYKQLNIKFNFPKNSSIISEKNGDIQIDNFNEQKIEKQFEIITDKLPLIKTNVECIPEIINNIKNVFEFIQNQNIIEILNKTIEILNLFFTKNIVVDNNCYTVILQSVHYAKKYNKNKSDNSIDYNKSILKKLNVIEDMFGISSVNTIEKEDRKTLISQLVKNTTVYELPEIKTLRVDSEKIDNLISQSDELLINGIKTREHLIDLSEINSKLLKWHNISKQINNYMKYLEKRGVFSSDANDTIISFYKRMQTFAIENHEFINELNIDFNKLYTEITEDGNKLHQTILGIENIAKKIRVLPLATIFHSFPRMMRDIAKEKNKKINFIISGSDTTVDKKIIEEIKMPLIHILRNAVAHGIEIPEERIKNNKDETGIITLSAKQSENSIIITIQDDGYGINILKIKNTAIDKGILTEEEADNMSTNDLMKLLFIPGFSTQETVNDISGRGIGLDIVKSKISDLHGEIHIDSALNQGCRVMIKIPLATSTIKTFILKLQNQKFAIPVDSIKYVKKIHKNDIFNNNGQNCIINDNCSIPIFSLSEIFTQKPYINDFYTIITIENQGKKAAYIIDEIMGEQEVFYKKLIPPIVKIKNVSGFSTLPNGEICLIINTFELIRNTVINKYLQSFDIKSLTCDNSSENNKKILLFNDNQIFLTTVKNDLNNKFNCVIEFNNINSVLDFIQQNKTEILVCTINNNFDKILNLIKHIKNDENLKEIKIIIFSEEPEYEIKQKFNEYKIDLYEKISNYNKTDFLDKILKM